MRNGAFFRRQSAIRISDNSAFLIPHSALKKPAVARAFSFYFLKMKIGLAFSSICFSMLSGRTPYFFAVSNTPSDASG